MLAGICAIIGYRICPRAPRPTGIQSQLPRNWPGDQYGAVCVARRGPMARGPFDVACSSVAIMYMYFVVSCVDTCSELYPLTVSLSSGMYFTNRKRRMCNRSRSNLANVRRPTPAGVGEAASCFSTKRLSANRKAEMMTTTGPQLSRGEPNLVIRKPKPVAATLTRAETVRN